MKCVSYTRTLPWKNHQGELTIAEQNQRIAAYLAEHKQRWTRGYKRYKETSGLIEWKECQIFHSIFT